MFRRLGQKDARDDEERQTVHEVCLQGQGVASEAALWHDNRYLAEADGWIEGLAYRLQVRGSFNLRYGMQIEILGIRPAVEEDAADGYDSTTWSRAVSISRKT